jgi:hypothetical protein
MLDDRQFGRRAQTGYAKRRRRRFHVNHVRRAYQIAHTASGASFKLDMFDHKTAIASM